MRKTAWLLVAFVFQCLLIAAGVACFRFALHLGWWESVILFMGVSIASGQTTLGLKWRI